MATPTIMTFGKNHPTPYSDHSTPQGISPIRVLIVEEHPGVRAALERRLSSTSQIKILHAVRSLAEAMLLVCDEKPDVVLLGLQGRRARHLVERGQAIAELTQCGAAVIVLVSYVDEMEREALLKEGSRRYLLKNINSSQLIVEIETVFNEISN